MLDPSKLIRLFANFGTIAIAGGATGYAVAIMLVRVCNIPEGLVSHFVYSITIASLLGSSYLDSKFEITSSLQRRIWTKERSEATTQLYRGLIDYRQALERAIHTEYELSVPANLLGRFFSRNIAKQVRDDKLWILRNVLPSVAPALGNRRDLSALMGVVTDLTECLHEVRQHRGLWSKVGGLFGSNSLAEDVRLRGLKRHNLFDLEARREWLQEEIIKLEEAKRQTLNTENNQTVMRGNESSTEPDNAAMEQDSSSVRPPLRVKN
jgi:hypothetical protein